MTTHTLPFNSVAHALQAAVDRSHVNGTPDNEMAKPFTFDLISFVKEIKTPRLKEDALSRLSFSIDAYIQAALSRLLNDFYQHSKQSPETSFATYQDFLHHIEGLEASEQSLYETGCDVTPSIGRIRNLVAFRNELHAVIASRLTDPSQYKAPSLFEFLANPKPRSLSAAAEMGLQDIVKDDAGDDEELAKELLAQYKLDAQLERMSQHRMDVMKSKALVLLASCLKLDAVDVASVTDEDDAFYDMDARTVYGLLGACLRSITDTRRKAVTDTRVPVIEKATLRVEAKALMATLTEQLAHPIFTEFV